MWIRGVRRFSTVPMVFRASIDPNTTTDILSGAIQFSPNGSLQYIADHQIIVGRGLGRWWKKDDNSFQAEMDVFQYPILSQEYIDVSPMHFKLDGKMDTLSNEENTVTGIIRTPEGVGQFLCTSNPANWPAWTIPFPYITSSEKTVSRIPKFRDVMEEVEGFNKDVYIKNNWLDSSYANSVIKEIDAMGYEKLKTRNTSELGSMGSCSCGKSLLSAPFPPLFEPIIQKLYDLEVFDPHLVPLNSIRINAYEPDEGIYPHTDSPIYYPRVAILSFLESATFSFFDSDEQTLTWDDEKDVPMSKVGQFQQSVIVAPNSLLVFEDNAYRNMLHGIYSSKEKDFDSVWGIHANNEYPRTQRRISFTIRHLLPRCGCQPILPC